MKLERILLDVATQNDFFTASGAYWNDSSPRAAKQIRILFDWAKAKRIPVISTVLRNRPYDRGPMGPIPHCVEGSDGERKLAGTVMRSRINLGLTNTTDLPPDLFERHQQVVFEQRNTDIFAHPRLERLITELEMCTFIICGAGVSKGIVQAAIGLRNRGMGVVVARDAILPLSSELAEMALLRMSAKGVVFAPAAEIVSPTPPKWPIPLRAPAHARK